MDHRIISFSCYQFDFYQWCLSIVQVVLQFNYVNKIPFYYDTNLSMYKFILPCLFIIWIFLITILHISFKLNFFRGIYTKKVSISSDLMSCSKKSIYYTDTDVKTGENSTYEELDLSRDEIPYQNTTILWLLQCKNHNWWKCYLKYNLNCMYNRTR